MKRIGAGSSGVVVALVLVAGLTGCPSSAPPSVVSDVATLEDTGALDSTEMTGSEDLLLDSMNGDGKDATVCIPDCEGKACGDDGCDGVCGKCPEDLACKLGQCIIEQTICGDGVCDGSEDQSNCPEDCGTPVTCGDGLCGPEETAEACPEDCLVVGPECGNLLCESPETADTCPGDCGGIAVPCFQAAEGEACCGDEQCLAPENNKNCAIDCAECGNAICEKGEHASCPEDCQTQTDCGNNTCDFGENSMNCPEDCEGPTACESDEDCAATDACPAGAALGCKCTTIMGGATGCVPVCQNDSDCPTVEGVVLHCTWQGLCKQGMM